MLYVSVPDQRFVVKKTPALLQEMINVGCQLIFMANSRGLHVYYTLLQLFDYCYTFFFSSIGATNIMKSLYTFP